MHTDQILRLNPLTRLLKKINKTMTKPLGCEMRRKKKHHIRWSKTIGEVQIVRIHKHVLKIIKQ